MSEESTTPDLVELVHGLIEALNARDLDAAMHFYASDAVLDVTRRLGIAPQGRDAIRGHYKDWLGAYDELTYEPEQIRDLGNGVVLVILCQKGRPVGVTGYVRQRQAVVSLAGDGLIVRATVYTDSTKPVQPPSGLPRNGDRRCRRRTWRRQASARCVQPARCVPRCRRL
jgi:ketosteroid isomerase-like protein